MTIEREGKRWELTSDELYEAYQEQQLKFDRLDIEENLDWILIGHCGFEHYKKRELIKNQKFLNLSAKYSRDMLDGEDVSFTAAMTEGVRKAITEMEASGEL